MIAVDTNLLVRALVDDPGQAHQVKAAREAVRRAGEVFVPQIVQVETVWVLESAYRLTRTQVVHVLEQLLDDRAYRLQNESAFVSALRRFTTGRAHFSDFLILAESEAAGHRLVTFDKRLLGERGTASV